MSIGPTPYIYKARVVSVYDGDTITVDIDLGLSTWLHGSSIRLFGIDTPELRGEERSAGLAARDHLRSLLPANTPIILRTIKDHTEKYGRYLGIIHFEDGNQYQRLPGLEWLRPQDLNQGIPITMRDEEIEAALEAKNKDGMRVTPAMLETEIISEAYHVFPGTTLTICLLTLWNGFSVTGESACAIPENFDEDLGRKIARDNAKQKLWPLLGFRLRDAIANGMRVSTKF